MKNSIISLCVFLLITVVNCSVAQTTPTVADWNATMGVLNHITGEINAAKGKLGQYRTMHAILKSQIEANATDKRKNVLRSITGPNAALLSLSFSIMDTMTGLQLRAEYEKIPENAEEYINTHIDQAIYQRQANVNANPPVISGYNQTWNRLMNIYRNLSDSDRSVVNAVVFNDNTTRILDLSGLYMAVPVWSTATIETIEKYGKSSNGCNEYYDSANEHKVTCTEKHGKSGNTNIVWWECFSTTSTKIATALGAMLRQL